MSLIDLWKEAPDQIRDKRVDQIIGFAGDGKLGDKNTAPAEFRAFLSRVPTDALTRYADECLETSFPNSGLALQDIVNEMARRIGFEIEYGRYRGAKGSIGFDGIWTAPNGHAIVVEVKTTDAYRLPIETVARYRRQLIRQDRLNEGESSILVVVGREDTGELEAQIRGSRHAWDVRLISVDALARLTQLRQDVEDPATETQIRSLLVPREYTRVDDIIDLVFSTSEDLQEERPPDEGQGEREAESEPGRSTKPVAFHNAVAEAVSKHLGISLAKESRIVYTDPDAGTTVTCAVSKEYGGDESTGYWFAFHPHQLDKLKAARIGFAAFGCGSAARVALFPLSFFEAQLEGLNQTHKDDGTTYWHVRIGREGSHWTLHRRKGYDSLEIAEMMVLAETEALAPGE
jgi:hypothetical protein